MRHFATKKDNIALKRALSGNDSTEEPSQISMPNLDRIKPLLYSFQPI